MPRGPAHLSDNEVGSDVRAQSKELEVSGVGVNSSKLKIMTQCCDVGKDGGSLVTTSNIPSHLRMWVTDDAAQLKRPRQERRYGFLAFPCREDLPHSRAFFRQVLSDAPLPISQEGS